jgi:hypothetical protein
VLSEIFASSAIDINQKIVNIVRDISSSDNLKVNAQIEVLNVGYRWSNSTYISVGFYQEFDAIVYFPKDLITIGIEGNSNYINKIFELSQIKFKADLMGVLHAGITRTVNDKLTVGGRFKIYSSALNMESINNTGTVTTAVGENNTYATTLEKINVNIKSSGIYKDEYMVSDPAVYLKNSFLGDNLGMGLDLGFTYHISPQFKFSGSLLDVGFIKHVKSIKNISAAGSFVFEGLNFEYDTISRDYWDEIETGFKAQLPVTENQKSYISWRSSKLNAAIKYSFGEKRSIKCYDNSHKKVFKNAFGAQLYTIFRPLNPQFAFTSFFEKSFSDFLHAKITYTLDDYSYTNIGVGISTQIRNVNFYGILEDIAKFGDVSSANNVSLQFGFNLIFN